MTVRPGDKVRVTATRRQLESIGVLSELSFDWLLDGAPKTVCDVSGDLVYLWPKERGTLWVRQAHVVLLEKGE